MYILLWVSLVLSWYYLRFLDLDVLFLFPG